MVTETDIEWFTEGDCWYLMLELSRLSRWPMYAFYRPGMHVHTFDPCWHGFVMRPDGLLLDIHGPQSTGEMWKRWVEDDEEEPEEDRPHGIMHFTRREFNWLDAPEFPGAPSRARLIAKYLLDIHGESQ